MIRLVIFLSLLFSGRVVDTQHQPIAYATVYPELIPECGTATNNDGYFSFEANIPRDSRIIISFIGYEKKAVMASDLLNDSLPFAVTLMEQPIALQETVVAAKAVKQKNKRKQMSALLHAVYNQLEQEFPDKPARYEIVSDVKMNSGAESQSASRASVWGMEQMIASVVNIPEQGTDGRDSVQFQARFCKRFFDADKRAQADSILASETIERLEKGQNQKMMRRAVNAVDSGVVVHRALFGMGNMRYDFEQAMNDTRHWTVSNESESETVLTHTESISRYLGCFKMTFQRHYILDSKTYSVRRFAEHAEIKVTIPFGIKLNDDQLKMLNLVNMDEQRIDKFRLRKLYGSVDLNTFYQRRDDQVYTLEKNMIVDALIVGAKEVEVPLLIKATQLVTSLQTENVIPFTADEITRRIPRQLVEIY